MPTLATWAGKSSFSYSGSVNQGTKISYGKGGAYSITVSGSQYAALLNNFRGRTVEIGTSRTDRPRGSLGEWLQANVTKAAIASDVGPIRIAGDYAARIGRSQIKFI
jgi:hypothetical protein